VPSSRLLPLIARRAALALLAAAVTPALHSAEPSPATASKAPNGTASWDLAEFVDRLPDLFPERLPGFEPLGALRLYVRPHFGDFLHRNFVRVPAGSRVKVTENIEFATELQSYFTHGLRHGAGYGLSGLHLGIKRERMLPALNEGGISVGLNYDAPLSRPPPDLTDGFRHLQPFVAATHALLPKWKLLGYATLSADFLAATAMPPHFGRNQLHANSLAISAGVAHEWTRFHGSLTASYASTVLMSNERHHVFALRPEIVLPWKMRPASLAQILFTVGGRMVRGPDGTEFGVSSSLRIEFVLRRVNPAK
jgi:hypothetical protein